MKLKHSKIMLDKNNLPFGLGLAIIVPVLVFGILYGLFEVLETAGMVSESGFRPMFRERTTSILGIGANAILLNSFQKKRAYNTVRGIVISTVLLVGIWVLVFGKYVF